MDLRLKGGDNLSLKDSSKFKIVSFLGKGEGRFHRREDGLGANLIFVTFITYIVGFILDGFFPLRNVTFSTLRADLEDCFKCMT